MSYTMNKAQQIAVRLARYDVLSIAKQQYSEGGPLSPNEVQKLAEIHDELYGLRFGVEDVRALLNEISAQTIRIATLVDENKRLYDQLAQRQHGPFGAALRKSGGDDHE